MVFAVVETTMLPSWNRNLAKWYTLCINAYTFICSCLYPPSCQNFLHTMLIFIAFVVVKAWRNMGQMWINKLRDFCAAFYQSFMTSKSFLIKCFDGCYIFFSLNSHPNTCWLFQKIALFWLAMHFLNSFIQTTEYTKRKRK